MTHTIQDLAREAQRKYQREWRAKNRDKVRQHNQNYWKKKAEQQIKEGEVDKNA